MHQGRPRTRSDHERDSLVWKWFRLFFLSPNGPLLALASWKTQKAARRWFTIFEWRYLICWGYFLAVCCTLLQWVGSFWMKVCNMRMSLLVLKPWPYGVATISMLLKTIGLFCRISSLLWGSFAKETYNFKEPTNQSHPIPCFVKARWLRNICVYASWTNT